MADLAGSINEPGFLENLTKGRGATLLSGLDEILANCIDARSKHIRIIDYVDTTINDDGKGMKLPTLRNMFDMYGLQKRHKTIGNFGIGGKVAMKLLSNTTTVTVVTLHEGVYHTAIVPWDEIYRTMTYTKMITLQPSAPEEIQMFQEQMPRSSGTTIKFASNPEFTELLEGQFNISRIAADKHLKMGIVPEKSMTYKFGRFDTQIEYVNDTGKTILLPKYNPSLKVQPCLGTRRNQINVYRGPKGTLRYITDSNKEIKSRGDTQYETKSTQLTDSQIESIQATFERVGTFSLEFYAPYVDAPPSGGDGSWVSPHAEDIFNPPEKRQSARNRYSTMHDSITVFKSNYPIGSVSIEGLAGCKRASFEGFCRYWVYADVHYETEDEGMLDEIVGIQENKNQLQDIFPIPCKRLIDELRFEYSKVLIRKYDKSAEPVVSTSSPVKEALVKARIDPPSKLESKTASKPAKPVPAAPPVKAPPAKASPIQSPVAPPSVPLTAPSIQSIAVPLAAPSIQSIAVPLGAQPIQTHVPTDSYTKLMQFIELHKGTPKLDDACKLLGL